MRNRRGPFIATGLLVLLAWLLVAGCDSPPTSPGGSDPDPDPGQDDPLPRPGLVVQATGRVERGLRIHLAMVDTTAGIDPGDDAPAWSAEPADAVEFVEPDDDGNAGAGSGPGAGSGTGAGGGKVVSAIEARLLRAGPVTITGKAGESTGRLTLQVAAPPTIVFDMVRDGNRDIYRAALDGADLVRLTSGRHDNRAPTVAGGRVVFVSYRDGNGELYSVPLAGGEEDRLTQTPDHEGEPALSADGRRLAYTLSVASVPKLWTAAGDATDAARAAPDFGSSGSIDAAPSWAPDGNRLVFVSTARGGADLFLYTPATGAVELVLGTDAPEVEPAWSPDGQWIAFTSARNGRTDIYRVRVTGGGIGEVEQLTDRAETDARPAWLADGRIVYVARVGGATRLRWLDPEEPGVVYEIPVGDGEIGRVVGVW